MQVGTGLLGREDELTQLERFRSGVGQGALVVRGAAGVGKTALIGALCSAAAADGWQVLRAIGVEAETPFTLGGLNQMAFGMRHLVTELDEQDRDVLAPAFGADPDQSPSPMALGLALLNLLAAAAQAQPVLLVVDDVQWFDDLSATVLNLAGRRLSHPRIRILAACRPQSGWDFATAGWIELMLGPLSAADSERVVNRMQVPLTSVVKQQILDVAAGNPLALEELPRCADQMNDWADVLPLTDRLVTVFGGRLRKLDAQVRTELLRAALDGTRANASTDTGSRYAMRNVQTAIDQDLLMMDPLGDIVFRHPLVRAAVIHQAGAQERREAHAQLAGLYDDVLVRRATHLSAAASEPDQQVADLLAQAAALSIRRGGSSAAVDWLRRAAQLSTMPGRRAGLLADAAFVAAQASRFDDAQTLLDTTQTDGEESISEALTGAYLALYRDGEVIATHRRVLAALGKADTLDDESLSRLIKLLLAITQYSGDAEHWRATEDLIERLGARVDEVSLIYRDAWGDTARRGHTVRARLAETMERLPKLEPWEVMRLAVAGYYVDSLADFRATLHRSFTRERDRGAVTNAITMSHLLMLDQFASGQWVAAESTARAGLELTDIHRNDPFSYQFKAYLSVLAAAKGDVEDARQLAAEVTGWAGPRRLGLHLSYALRAAVLAALAEADYEAAYGAAIRIGGPGKFPPYAHQATDSLLDLVEAAVHTGRREEARAHAEAAVRLGLPEVSPRLAALTAAALAMTAPDDDADGLYEAAVADPAIASFPFEHARVRLAQGVWLRRQRFYTRARESLTLAADTFDSLGARPWLERARAELRAAGATLKRSLGDLPALSAQERRIAELAATGHTNKQIAAQLYLSPRTVGAHLYRIFPKLGITSRAGLSQALRQFDTGITG